MTWFFASDLHGSVPRYEALFAAVRRERPAAVLLGGDLLPGGFGVADARAGGFLAGWLAPGLTALRDALGPAYPRVLFVPGNDDPAAALPDLDELAGEGLLEPLHGRRARVGGHDVLGYACIPPTPFPLKDWEKYDVSRFVDPGCVSPEDGRHSVPADASALRWGTIAADLEALAAGLDPERAIVLFHAPPYRSALDRAALDGRMVDWCPVDVHVGSIAVRRFIEAWQPLATLHGHVHESVRLTGTWRERLGRTWALGAAHDGPELALVRFDPDEPGAATRELLGPS